MTAMRDKIVARDNAWLAQATPEQVAELEARRARAWLGLGWRWRGNRHH